MAEASFSSSVTALVAALARARGVHVVGIAREASLGELGHDVQDDGCSGS